VCQGAFQRKREANLRRIFEEILTVGSFWSGLGFQAKFAHPVLTYLKNKAFFPGQNGIGFAEIIQLFS